MKTIPKKHHSRSTHPLTADLGWFRHHLVAEVLPKWLMAVTEEGLFLPHFDRAWRPLGRNFGTLVSQCRLLYNFSQGYALTQERVYRTAVERGAQFLLEHFCDRKYGGWYWSCSLDGGVLDRRKDSYGHAFVIFGLAHAYHCTGDQTLQEALVHTWDVVNRRFRDEQGGFRWRMTETFAEVEAIRSQNPLMHLFEALLAAGTVGKVPDLLNAAREVGDFVLFQLVRKTDRRLPEVYDTTWQELPPVQAAETMADSPAGGRLDIGHAFEWAYLASYAVEQGFPAEYMAYANSFMLYGLALGFDWQAGGIYSPATPTGQLMARRKGWWEQCEAIRAMLHFVARHHRDDLVEPLQKTIGFVRGSLIDPVYGGWYPTSVESGVASEALEKGNEWKVDYHVVGMCMEAIRLTEQGMEHSDADL